MSGVPGRAKRVTVLGIESTAHTYGVGIVTSEKPYILANEYVRYAPKTGGIHPREAARYLSANAHEVLRRALKKAGLTMQEVDAIAVALGPGMGPSLRVGASVARALAVYYDKPLVPVNHAVAHIEIGKLVTGAKDPVVVYLSGGNTLIAALVDGRYRVFGETLDISLGNLLDVFARETGLAPPYVVDGIHQVDRCAERGAFIKEALPYVVKGQDVSFSGLLTAALSLWESGKYRVSDICYTLREIAYSSVVEVAERCMAHTGKNEVLLVGGVAASPVLRRKIELMASARGARAYVVPPEYAGDNGAMIAWTGLLQFEHGIVVEPSKAFIKQRWRLDEVDIPWG